MCDPMDCNFILVLYIYLLLQHTSDLGLSLAVCTHGDVRLMDGYSSNNGFAQICIDGIWLWACTYGSQVLKVICNQLGFQRKYNIQ